MPIVMAYTLAEIVPLLPRPDNCAKSAQRCHRRNPRNCLVTNSIGDYFEEGGMEECGPGGQFQN